MSIIDILTTKNNAAWICLKCAAKIRLSNKSNNYIIIEMPNLKNPNQWAICDLCTNSIDALDTISTPLQSLNRRRAIGIVTRDTK